MLLYHCDCFDVDEKRIGGFVISADDMAEALLKASRNIEVAIRPNLHEIRITRHK